MSEKKRLEKNKPLPELRPSVTEVLVANGRAFQPFIRTFSSTGENISRASLGTLTGVFEIDDQSEDSAYIVNFLASVAKKEYFSNPRRGAVESFEAALHKINLALAELVKHGNITWLGKFHGALGVLEKNNFHFSVSGNAKILLLRNESLADISEGLSSEESQLHPIKTFVEVSSGRLMEDDQILIGSPELLALFSLEELEKNAARMGRDRFTQFLKTALVNELDMTGLIIIDIFEGSTPLTPNNKSTPAETSPVRVNNVFSQSAFLPKKESEALSVEEVLVRKQTEEEEYVDSKTGHIYVQGETPETGTAHPFFEQLGLHSQETFRSLRFFFAARGKSLRRGKKQGALFLQTVSEETRAVGRKSGRFFRRHWRKWQEKRAERIEAAAQVEATKRESVQEVPSTPRVMVSDIPPKKNQGSPLENIFSDSPALPLKESATTTEISELPHFIKEKLRSFYQKEDLAHRESSPESNSTESESRMSLRFHSLRERFTLLVRSSAERGRHLCSLCQAHGNSLLHSLKSQVLPLLEKGPSRESIQAGIASKKTLFALLLLGGGIVFFFLSSIPSFFSQIETVQNPTGAESSDVVAPPQPEQQDQNVGEMLLAYAPGENIVAPVILNGESYLVTEKTIIALSDDKKFPIPNGRATFATAMNDLRLLFVVTDNGKLYAFSPISKTFAENSLPFSTDTKISGLGSYLTYLYVLDDTTDQIYRFPRADGGFGAGTAWLKESVALDEVSMLAVNETLFISLTPSLVTSYFRGRAARTLETPAEGMSLTSLYTSPGLNNVYGLDREKEHIFVWNLEGRLIKTLHHENISTGQTLAVNEGTGEILIGTPKGLFSFKLK